MSQIANQPAPSKSLLTLQQVESRFDLVPTPTEFPSKSVFLGRIAGFFRQTCTLLPTVDNAVFASRDEFNFVNKNLNEQGIQKYINSYRNALIVGNSTTAKATWKQDKVSVLVQGKDELVVLTKPDESQEAITYQDYEKLDAANAVHNKLAMSKKNQLKDVYNSILEDLHNPYFNDWVRRYPLLSILSETNGDISELCENLETKLRMYVLDVQVAHSPVLAAKLVELSRATLGVEAAKGTTVEQVISSLNECAAFGVISQLAYINFKHAEFLALNNVEGIFDKMRNHAIVMKQLETVLDANPLAPYMALLCSKVSQLCSIIEESGSTLLPEEKQVLKDLDRYGNRKMTRLPEPKTLSDVTKLFDICETMLSENHEEEITKVTAKAEEDEEEEQEQQEKEQEDYNLS